MPLGVYHRWVVQEQRRADALRVLQETSGASAGLVFRQPHFSVDLLALLEVEHGVGSLDNGLWIREAAALGHAHTMIATERASFPAATDGHSLREEGFVEEVVVVLQLVPDGNLPWLG